MQQRTACGPNVLEMLEGGQDCSKLLNRAKSGQTSAIGVSACAQGAWSKKAAWYLH